VKGPAEGYPHWDASWRTHLVSNLEILVHKLWDVGIDAVYVDGFFVEDKDHPNDIDGYFECDWRRLISGDLQDALHQRDPHRIWTWDPAERCSYRGYPKHQLPMWHQYPLRSFTLQLDEEVEAYERMQRGSFEPIENLAGLGRLLIAARIFRKISQRDLGKMLGVHESQVSRDERNEYRSITVERASRILDVLGARLTSELRPLSERFVKPAQLSQEGQSGRTGVAPLSEVAEYFHVSREMVGKWRQRFVERRLDGLLDEPRPGAPRQISDAKIEQGIVTTLETTPRDATYWSTRALVARTGLSQSTIARVWRAFGLLPHLTPERSGGFARRALNDVTGKLRFQTRVVR